MDADRTFRSFMPAVAMVLTGSLFLASCGQGRSVANFCADVETGMQRVRDTLDDRNEAYRSAEGTGEIALNALAGLIEVHEDVLAMYRALAKSAPSEIQGDAERLAELYAEQLDIDVASSQNEALGDLFGSVVGGVQTFTALKEVDEFARAECQQSVIVS